MAGSAEVLCTSPYTIGWPGNLRRYFTEKIAILITTEKTPIESRALLPSGRKTATGASRSTVWISIIRADHPLEPNMRNLFFKHPILFKWVMNLWPPFLFTGIKIVHISEDFRYTRVDLKWRPWTRNINNTQYGGSLFSMTDPIYALMLFGCLGWDRYLIWDKSADIDFIAPGKGRLTAEFHIEDTQLHDIKHHTESGEKYFPEFVVHVRDQDQNLVCTVKRTLYVRLRPKHR
ncbi:MAG: DUF4442 domain-containing protein [Saccharospirillum sp.]|nr:DUF4442 domain-containing protein [Saccharospirillum sp.]